MSRYVKREDIVDFATYEDNRAEIRTAALEAKKPRRVHLNEYLTFLFENRQTMIYQIQEITRAERIVREKDIEAELETYNAMIGAPGEIGCVLLIEIAEKDDRKPLLTKWLGLQNNLYVLMEDGSKIYASFDESQVGDDRISAVQYLTFKVDGQTPVGIGTDFEALQAEVKFDEAQYEAIKADINA